MTFVERIEFGGDKVDVTVEVEGDEPICVWLMTTELAQPGVPKYGSDGRVICREVEITDYLDEKTATALESKACDLEAEEARSLHTERAIDMSLGK